MGFLNLMLLSLGTGVFEVRGSPGHRVGLSSSPGSHPLDAGGAIHQAVTLKTCLEREVAGRGSKQPCNPSHINCPHNTQFFFSNRDES